MARSMPERPPGAPTGSTPPATCASSERENVAEAVVRSLRVRRLEIVYGESARAAIFGPTLGSPTAAIAPHDTVPARGRGEPEQGSGRAAGVLWGERDVHTRCTWSPRSRRAV